ncbi:uncharacterized protein Z519_01827 [Cladophialophora bantiana CBS 173.52]|uniref:Major facilitator superfamily (MFS) profile domain-containing protein n=1 Tax=Cladophialophora bantiana (strain ATCC 10958 / CBS 173.52 / CDC B-1940 / NIH 8579) TaxID=1442370 RepID=A0A0D2HXU9_CLAB1|nr:uncharacterized protein Z519_01827 [Cladophialophora bantiana CBS 173.52]KIW98243.1 hypothetical protein Z519_01827 [Cladophialophora bantiana CBS 173.52]
MKNNLPYSVAEVASLSSTEKAGDFKHAEEKVTGHVAEQEINPRVVRKIVRKIDARLVPILGLLHAVSLIDRGNLGGARIAGIDEATNLDVGSRASIVILVFYIGYIVMEIPSNILIKKLGAANWMSFLAVCWGVVCIGIGYSKNWQTLAVCRVILGLLEAGIYPGAVYLCGSWYPRYEVQLRIAIFAMIGMFLSGFGNILAYGLTQIAQQPEVNGWKWIFIVEGCLTLGVAVLVRLILVDFPHSKRNKFLTQDEKIIVHDRLVADRGLHETEKVTWKVVGATFADWRVWAMQVRPSHFSACTSNYSYTFFLPIILRRGMGFSQEASFLLTAPPAFVSALIAIGTAYVADRLKFRGPFILGTSVFAIVGIAMVGWCSNPAGRYTGVFFGQIGGNALAATTLAWMANNMRGDAKRAVATAIQVMMGGVGGVYSALVFRQQDTPNYIPGIIATMVSIAVPMIITLVMMPLLRRANRQADAGTRVIEGAAEFRYTL